MEIRIVEVAERIRTLREIMNFTMEEMAEAVNYTVERYEAAERGEIDFSINFLYKCADKFGVDMVEILTGEKPHLSFY
ncbi:MAG: helix-turn-helix transcriptional regulator, partial [Oscillospiraceae bacterium]